MNKIKGYWTFDNVKENALKYKTRNDFCKLSKSAYLAAYRNGWLDDDWLDDVCSHIVMKIIKNISSFNEWVLQNSEKENDIYKKVFRKEELEDLLSKQNIKVNIL